jgi:hypothetical protein
MNYNTLKGPLSRMGVVVVTTGEPKPKTEASSWRPTSSQVQPCYYIKTLSATRAVGVYISIKSEQFIPKREIAHTR